MANQNSRHYKQGWDDAEQFARTTKHMPPLRAKDVFAAYAVQSYMEGWNACRADLIAQQKANKQPFGMVLSDAPTTPQF